MTRPVLLDTDLGSDVDDALALALLLASPELRLEALTTVGREPAERARMAARLLGLAGRRDVAVSAGAGAALLRPDRFGWWGHEGLGLPEGPDARLSDEPAAERIVRTAREVPGLELVLIGPLTNLARALALDPELPRRVERLTVMGGHVRRVAIGAHEVPPGIDYNLCSDPEASTAVLGAGFATTLVTADVTLQVWLRPADLDAIAAVPPLGPGLAALVRHWTPVQRRIFGSLGGGPEPDNLAYLHDPLTVLALVDPSPLVWEDLRIVPTIQAGVFRTHELPQDAGPGAVMRVATAVDARAAERAMVQRLSRPPMAAG